LKRKERLKKKRVGGKKFGRGREKRKKEKGDSKGKPPRGGETERG